MYQILSILISNTQTAPIFIPNNVGGYMPSQPMAPKVENNKPNSALYALSRGYVVASPATRGRTNKASDGNFIGKAPAVIVDLQAATAYLHANDATMPGNAKRIICLLYTSGIEQISHYGNRSGLQKRSHPSCYS